MSHSSVLRGWILGVAGLLLISGSAVAQPDETITALRRENEELRQRVAQLEAQLETARQEAVALRLANEELVRVLREVPAREPAQSVTATEKDDADLMQEDRTEYPDPSLAEPLAYPDALLVRLRESYAEMLGDVSAERRQSASYLAEVRRWASVANRTYRGRIDWVVSVADEEGAIPADQPLRVFVVDAETLRPLHRDPFVVEMESRDRRRIDEESSRRAWRLVGTMESDVRVNAERAEQGVINTPPYIGAFAEFGFVVRGVGLAPWEPSDAE